MPTQRPVESKAPRIRKALHDIQDRTGRLSLGLLTKMPLDEAKAWLQSIDGVGPKTAACVLMFCYNLPAFPVDTHVHRVARRLALIPDDCNADRPHFAIRSSSFSPAPILGMRDRPRATPVFQSRPNSRDEGAAPTRPQRRNHFAPKGGDGM